MTNSDLIKVSVVMPVYNADSYLRPALDSVLAQTLDSIELICIDDGSVDRSLEIIKEYQKIDSRIRIITENNAGPASARNKGLARARGEYVIFLDADDFFEPRMLESLYNLATKNDLDISLCGYDVYNTRKARFEPKIPSEHSDLFAPGKILSKNEYPDYIFQTVTTYVWNKLFRRSFLLDKGIQFPKDVRVFEDVYFVLTAMSMAERVGKVFDVLMHHRVYSNQSKNKLFKKYYMQVPVMYVMVKDYLTANGMYSPLSQSFLNYTSSRCYKLYNLLWHDAKEEFWNSLHDTYAEQLGWTQASADDFENIEIRDFTANILVYPHSQYHKRELLGIKVRIKGVGRAIKSIKLKKKIKAVWYRIIGKPQA